MTIILSNEATMRVSLTDRSAVAPATITNYDYDYIYSSLETHESYKNLRLFHFESFDNYTSPDVLNNGCHLTVVVVDPRLPISAYNHSMWYALESVASYANYSCVVINTASCQILAHVHNVSNVPTNQQEVTMVAKSIYDRSLPLFRQMMENGQVRINILDSKKYGLNHCDDFGNGNSIFMNVHFWIDEFIEGLDSDMILTVQGDSVLCRHFEIDLWKHFAYVGAPWAPWVTTCDSFRATWQEWASKCNGLTNYQANESMSQLCAKGLGVVQGNGGLSIRNKTWMVEVILRCPTQYSGLETHELFDFINEDLYFSNVLNGLNATMPTAFEASLFSVKTLFPEQTVEYNSIEKI